ncbi:MAG: hypothetical protein ABGU93_06825 [Acetobacterium sp.]|uniref:hypothetical protein n=1 Tax=Acetobacterium sp. TaxID=1872094 RepID=UPI003242AD44
MLKPFTGHCPTFDEDRTIMVYFKPFNVLGGDSPVHKAATHDCDDVNECKIGNCPIFLKAAKTRV